jgi:hypothetical protein
LAADGRRTPDLYPGAAGGSDAATAIVEQLQPLKRVVGRGEARERAARRFSLHTAFLGRCAVKQRPPFAPSAGSTARGSADSAAWLSVTPPMTPAVW